MLVPLASCKLGQFNFTWLLQGVLCIHPISISMNVHNLKSLRDFQRATCAKSPPSTSCHVVSSLRSAFCSLSQPTAALPTFGVTIYGALLVSWQGKVGYVRHLRSGWASCNSSPDGQNFLSCNGAVSISITMYDYRIQTQESEQNSITKTPQGHAVLVQESIAS